MARDSDIFCETIRSEKVAKTFIVVMPDIGEGFKADVTVLVIALPSISIAVYRYLSCFARTNIPFLSKNN